MIGLSIQDERLLEMYSRGESYEIIQLNLETEYGIKLGKAKLGKEIGRIKLEQNCATQFELGYKYHHHVTAFGKGHVTWNDVKNASTVGFKQGKESEISNKYVYINKGLNRGVVFTTIFWLVIVSLLLDYLNCF